LYTTPTPAKKDADGKTTADAKVGTIMSLVFDSATGYVWAGCDNSCAGSMQIHQINPSTGKFEIIQKYAGPPSMATFNNEGFTINPTCDAGSHQVFWSDDSANNGYSIRSDNIPCVQLAADFAFAPTMTPTMAPTMPKSSAVSFFAGSETVVYALCFISSIALFMN
jgi:hypothetical protein